MQWFQSNTLKWPYCALEWPNKKNAKYTPFRNVRNYETRGQEVQNENKTTKIVVGMWDILFKCFGRANGGPARPVQGPTDVP